MRTQSVSAPVIEQIEPLRAGDNLTWEEFEARWNATPNLKRAELIGGIVYMPPPLSEPHSDMETEWAVVLGYYAAHTPGCKAGGNATWRMFRDAPQPDKHLRIKEEYGGKSRREGKYLRGAPELLVEVCVSTASYDLHQKKDLYERAGVEEFLVELLNGQLRYYRLQRGKFRLRPIPSDGVFRSRMFPGLWVDVPALLSGRMLDVLKTLNAGIASDEHQRFVETLAARRRKRA